MQIRHLLIAASVAACQGCNPLRRLWTPAKVHSWSPDALPAHARFDIVMLLDNGAPRTAGLTLWTADGHQAASIDCKLTHEVLVSSFRDLAEVTCSTLPLTPGNYSMLFSSDRSCGPKSYEPFNASIAVIEPPQVAGASPAHGPAKASTSVKITGSNIGGPHVFCDLTFPAAPGAKFGCESSSATVKASEVTSTSAVCEIPKWSGPITQYDGHGGFHPMEDAKCSREVQIQLTNEGTVYSQEPLVFRYDDEAVQVLV